MVSTGPVDTPEKSSIPFQILTSIEQERRLVSVLRPIPSPSASRETSSLVQQFQNEGELQQQQQQTDLTSLRARINLLSSFKPGSNFLDFI
jgi:hypothetical protein